MDFHSLSRRELQSLCKKNKIPANTTNIAMADSLKSLDIVEGMEKFLTEIHRSSIESPEKKTVIASPRVPRTGGRTSTRRKPIRDEPESVQISTMARRGRRKAIAEEEVKDAKLDVAETQLKEEENNVPETPAATTNGRRGRVASAGRKMVETPVSFGNVYSTRRSTRLLEKKMTELNLNDKEGIEPVDFGPSDKEMPNDLANSVEVKGLNQLTVSDDLLVKADDLEALSDKKSDEMLENVRELEQVSEIVDGSDVVLVSDENTDGFTIEKGEDADDEVHYENKAYDDDDNDELQTVVGFEGYGESDVLSGENLEKSLYLKDEIPEKEGSNVSGFDTYLSDMENTAECLMSENGEEGINAENDVCLKDSAAVLSSGSICSDVMDTTVNDLVSGDSVKTEFDSQANKDSDISTGKDQIGVGYGYFPELNDVRDLELGLAPKELSDKKAPCDDAKTDLEVYQYGVQDLKSALIGEDKQLGNEEEVTQETLNCGEESVKLVIETSNEEGSDSETLNYGEESDSNEKGSDSETLNYGEESDSNEEASDSEKPAIIESAVQVAEHAMIAQEYRLVPETQTRPCSEISENNIVQKFTGNLITSAKDMVPSPVIPSAEVSVEMPFSTLAADPLLGQMSSSFLQLGSNSDSVMCPTSLTPVKKSASKTPTTSRKVNRVIMDDNKENIGNSGKQLDLIMEKGKKDEKKDDDLLSDKSLRQLKKALKQKLNISNTTGEEKNIAKVGKARPALQTLPENRLAASEPENEI